MKESVKYYAFKGNKNLWVCNHIDLYLPKAKVCCNRDLLKLFNKFYQTPQNNNNLYRLKVDTNIVSSLGIDCNTFKAHSIFKGLNQAL